MNRFSLNIISLSALILIAGCNSATKPDVTDTTIIDSIKVQTIIAPALSPHADDSIKLTKLVRDVYKWVETSGNNDGFKPLKKNTTDTLLTGIDLADNALFVQKLKATVFFNNEFLTNYRNLALRMDKELRNESSLWRDGEISPFSNDANPWCNCQDNPDDYWEKLTLTGIKINNNVANFSWTWGDNFLYKVKAKREDGIWKISYLEGWGTNNFYWNSATKSR